MLPFQYVEKAADLLGVHPGRLTLSLTSKYLNRRPNTPGYPYVGDRSTISLTDSFITPFYFDVCEKGIEMNEGPSRIILNIRSRRCFETVHNMCLSAMPACCGILISHGVFTTPKFQRKGINNLFNEMRIDIAKQWGYSALLCTDVSTNVAERKTLSKNGWKDVHSFTNKRTNRPLCISVKEL